MESDSEEQGPKSTSERQRISILRKAFDVYDVDGSGAIDYKEFKRLLDDLGWPSHDEFLRRAVRVLDQDMSGEIEFSEFQKWTKFAYTSRILYRQEMYGSGPRYIPNDAMTLRPIIEKDQPGRTGLIIRRASLKTVFEKPEESNVAASKPEGDGDYDSGEVDENSGGASLRGRTGLIIRRASLKTVFEKPEESNVAASKPEGDGDYDSGEVDENSGGASLRGEKARFHEEQEEDEELVSDRDVFSKSRSRKKCLQSSRGLFNGKFRRQHVSEKKAKEESLRSDHSARHIEEQTHNDKLDDFEIIHPDFVASVQEVDAMTLRPSDGGNEPLLVVAKSQSVGILREQRTSRLDLSESEEDTPCEFGPRSDSKMTVRLRWACGQLGEVAAEPQE